MDLGVQLVWLVRSAKLPVHLNACFPVSFGCALNRVKIPQMPTLAASLNLSIPAPRSGKPMDTLHAAVTPGIRPSVHQILRSSYGAKVGPSVVQAGSINVINIQAVGIGNNDAVHVDIVLAPI